MREKRLVCTLLLYRRKIDSFLLDTPIVFIKTAIIFLSAKMWIVSETQVHLLTEAITANFNFIRFNNAVARCYHKLSCFNLFWWQRYVFYIRLLNCSECIHMLRRFRWPSLSKLHVVTYFWRLQNIVYYAILYITVGHFSNTVAHKDAPSHTHINLTNSAGNWANRVDKPTAWGFMTEWDLESTAHRVTENVTKSPLYIYQLLYTLCFRWWWTL